MTADHYGFARADHDALSVALSQHCHLHQSTADTIAAAMLTGRREQALNALDCAQRGYSDPLKAELAEVEGAL